MEQWQVFVYTVPVKSLDTKCVRIFDEYCIITDTHTHTRTHTQTHTHTYTHTYTHTHAHTNTHTHVHTHAHMNTSTEPKIYALVMDFEDCNGL